MKGVVQTTDADDIFRGHPDPKVSVSQAADQGEQELLVVPLGQDLTINLHLAKMEK